MMALRGSSCLLRVPSCNFISQRDTKKTRRTTKKKDRDIEFTFKLKTHEKDQSQFQFAVVHLIDTAAFIDDFPDQPVSAF